jgi:hypothetical protein
VQFMANTVVVDDSDEYSVLVEFDKDGGVYHKALHFERGAHG